jgi:hypothetical protein
MSLYREPGRRSWVAISIAVAASLVIGAVVGYFIGRASKDEPTLSEQVADLRGEAQPLRLAVDQVRIEYPGTVREGKVVSPTEYEATRATVARAAATFSELQSDLAVIAPAGTDRVDRGLRALSDLVERRASVEEVKRQATQTDQELSAAVGSDREADQ